MSVPTILSILLFVLGVKVAADGVCAGRDSAPHGLIRIAIGSALIVAAAFSVFAGTLDL